jgi:hypothetical protein
MLVIYPSDAAAIKRSPAFVTLRPSAINAEKP